MKTYDLAAVTLIIGGFEISGYGEDGAVEAEFPGDEAEHMVGADGAVVISRINDARMIVKITVLETSRSARDLDELCTAQHATPTAIVPLSFLLIDTITGDEVADPYPVFTKRAAPSKGKAVGERVFEILLPSGKKGFKAGTLIVL